jgi:capsular polysaccharide transport system ATP-binding protein
MIKLINITKTYKTRFGDRTILDNINLTIKPSERIGILGRNGSGKSTLLRIIGGIETSSSGKVTRDMSVSWPIGLAGGLQHTLTGLDNLRFICRVYGKDYEDKRRFIEDFTELGHYLREIVANYSTGMRAKLALGISLVLDFDCYLVDEILSVGDNQLQEKYKAVLEQRKSKALILVSHLPKKIIDNCNSVYILNKGKLTHFNNAGLAIKFYNCLKNDGAIELR